MMNEKLVENIKEEYKDRFNKKEFIYGKSIVPISGKVFDEREITNMIEAVLDGWWTEGVFAGEMERKLCNYLGVKYSALVNSGSSANLVAISALTSMKLKERRLKPGDEVITVAAGFPTTVNPIIQNNLVPVFVDIDLGTYNASLEQIKQAIGPKTKAIFLAHTLGNPYDLEEIAELCEEHNLWLIEDCCDALGSTYNGKKVGTFGHISTCSFYPAHHITMGEGGAVFTNDALLSRIVKSIRDWGRDCWCGTGKDDTCKQRFCWKLGNLPQGYDHKYTYSELGYNLKVTDMQAALGVAQMDKIDGFVQKRKDNFKYLYDGLKKYEEYFILPKWSNKADPSWFGFLLTVKDSANFSRDELINFLITKKISTRLLFAGNITKQPYFTERDIKYKVIGELENTNKVMTSTFWIGVYPGITKEMLDYVLDCFGEFLFLSNNKPLLSICIPTYNRGAKLNKSLDIITKQFNINNIKKIEIIISDNASNDLTSQIVKNYQKKNKNIKYFCNKTNIGFDRNVDKVITKSEGVFCWMLSDDDFIIDKAIQFVLSTIKNNPEVSYICISDNKNDNFSYFESGIEFLKNNGLKGGLLSQNIIKKKAICDDKDKYFDNLWFHYSVILESISNSPVVIIPNLFILKEDNNCRWAINGLNLKTYIYLKNIVKNLIQFGYDKKLILKLEKSFATGLPRIVLSSKKHGLKFSFKNYSFIFNEFKRFPFWLLLSSFCFLFPINLLKKND